MSETAMTLPVPRALPAGQPETGPVLVAVNPADGQYVTLRMAWWLADQAHRDLHVLSVVESEDIAAMTAGVPPLPAEYYEEERAKVTNNLRACLPLVVGRHVM